MTLRERACILLATALFLLLTAPGWAVEPQERLPDPAQEARARSLGQELRCLVCQNTSIDESNADLARDLRLVLRERIKAGDTDDQVLHYMVKRYGQFVLLRPAFSPVTYVLWLGPPLLLVGGGAWLLLRSRRGRVASEPALSPDDQARAMRLLNGGGEHPHS